MATPFRTPRIQRLAEEGALFRRAFLRQLTLLAESRLPADRSVGAQLRHVGDCRSMQVLPPSRAPAARLFREAGYQTVRTGIQHVVKDPEEGGYERIEGGDGGDRGAALRAASFIAGVTRSPLFPRCGLWCNASQGRGFDGPPEGIEHADPRYVRPPDSLPDTG